MKFVVKSIFTFVVTTERWMKCVLFSYPQTIVNWMCENAQKSGDYRKTAG